MNTVESEPADAREHGSASEREPMADTLQASISAIRSETLLRGQPSVAIHHQGSVYRLQATRQGKLILTK